MTIPTHIDGFDPKGLTLWFEPRPGSQDPRAARTVPAPYSNAVRKTRLFLEWNWAMLFPPDISHFGYRRTQRRALTQSVPTPVTLNHPQAGGLLK
jgi:hypothetical protein